MYFLIVVLHLKNLFLMRCIFHFAVCGSCCGLVRPPNHLENGITTKGIGVQDATYPLLAPVPRLSRGVSQCEFLDPKKK